MREGARRYVLCDGQWDRPGAGGFRVAACICAFHTDVLLELTPALLLTNGMTASFYTT